jgi:mRNA interferase HigB
MHIITEKRLREFWEYHPDSEGPLRAWASVVRQVEWENFAEIREFYPHADRVGPYTVFNVGGNKYRLVTAIHFNRLKVYIRYLFTHKEYDIGDWKR